MRSTINEAPDDRILFSVADAARILGRTKEEIVQAIDTRAVPTVKILNETLIPAHYIDQQFPKVSQPSQSKRATYNPSEVAKLFGISKSTVHKAIKLGEIPSIRFFSRSVVPANWVDRQLARGIAKI